MTDEHGYYSEGENRFVEAPKRQWFRIQIPYILRFGIIWTLFFIILGLIIQSIRYSHFAFPDFFTSNYADWFRSFGNFSDKIIYPTSNDFIMSLVKDWYYFFYTGGLVSLIWGVLSWMIHLEFVVKKPEKKMFQEPRQIEPEKEFVKPSPLPVEEPKNPLESLLEKGQLALSKKRISEAEIIYLKIKSAYNPMQDSNHRLYKKILDFYDELVEAKGK